MSLRHPELFPVNKHLSVYHLAEIFPENLSFLVYCGILWAWQNACSISMLSKWMSIFIMCLLLQLERYYFNMVLMRAHTLFDESFFFFCFYFPFPSLGDLPDPGINPWSPALRAIYHLPHQGNPTNNQTCISCIYHPNHLWLSSCTGKKPEVHLA